MPKWSDEHTLEILAMRDVEGMTALEICDVMRAKVGPHISRNAICGVLDRITKAIEKHDPTGHLDGTMPEFWWRDGCKMQTQKE